MQDEVTIHWFGYANELEEELLKWVFYKVTGDKDCYAYQGKYKRRKKRGCECTEIEAAEIILLFSFYREKLKQELKIFMIGFKVGNGLFPVKTARCYQEDSGHLPERTDEEKRMLKKAAMYSMMFDKEKPPRALIGESGESN